MTISKNDESPREAVVATQETRLSVDFQDKPLAYGAVDPEDLTLNPRGWKSLSLAELQPYLQDPYWVRVRMVAAVLFWLTQVVLLTAALGLAVEAASGGQGSAFWRRDVLVAKLTSQVGGETGPPQGGKEAGDYRGAMPPMS
uniref:(California timema) hypothetical protein n=1 Tax=Timema californicum TaxID=61474 RepID=A0A7R9J578_TIMCA|nr:unnamed protein product [Timema californicum]